MKQLLVLASAFAVAVASAADGTWTVRSGVGTSGINWAQWSAAENWTGGTVASGADATAYLDTAAGNYVWMADKVSLKSLRGNERNRTVVAGDHVVAFGASGQNAGNILRVSLYSDFSWTTGSVYYGPNETEICGNCVSRSGWQLHQGFVDYRFDRYATSSASVRENTSAICPIHANGKLQLSFYAPVGSATNTTASWSQTAGSPFLKRAAGQSEHVLSVGTLVTGTGIPASTFLKRVFPDGTIQLSANAEETIASNPLTFAAFTADVRQRYLSFRPYNSGGLKTLMLAKSRAEDALRIQFDVFAKELSGSDVEFEKFRVYTRDGYLPGVLAIGDHVGYHGAFSLGDSHLEFVETSDMVSKSRTPGFPRGEFTVDDGATARFDAPAGVSAVLGSVASAHATVVKGGEGSMVWGVPEIARAENEMAYVVAGGTLALTNLAETADLYLPTLTVRATGTFVTPTERFELGAVAVEQGGTLVVDGETCVCASLTVAAGGTVRVTSGVLSVGTLTLAAGAIVEGPGHIEYATSAGVNSSEAILRKGGSIVSDAPSGKPFVVELLSGSPDVDYVDGKMVYIFRSDATLKINGSGTFDVFAVGGGGGGGSGGGGGGGGGGVVSRLGVSAADGVYAISVGAGGLGGTSKTEAGVNGGDSIAFGVSGLGGGGGGTDVLPGLNGGSGGGGGARYTVDSIIDGGAGTVGQGFAGGASRSTSSDWYGLGGGGGGAGEAGEAAWYEEVGNQKSGAPGNGGDGVACPFYGSLVYGGGGGGGNALSGKGYLGAGGAGGGGIGGGNSSAVVQNGTDGVDGLGGGGGGGGRYDRTYGSGGRGGRGIVIVRFTPERTVLPDDAVATGGIMLRRKSVMYHTFAANGTLTVSEPVLVDALLVGGGGGGGSYSGGGGGGGGVVVLTNLFLQAGSYGIVVGAGGLGSARSSATATSGGNSAIVINAAHTNLVALGGGAGGTRKAGGAGGNGGGGGADYFVNPTTGLPGGESVDGSGFAGGSGTNEYNRSWSTQGGGGGGAGAAGANAFYMATGETRHGGDGGAGRTLDFTGSSVVYGGGGGGGSTTYGNSPEYYVSAGGVGGGGCGAGCELVGGSIVCHPAESGTNGLGGGGGGGAGSGDDSSAGGNGGSGLVVIRYRLAPRGMRMIFR